MTQWLPLVLTLVTVFSGLVVYVFQKRRDRIEDLIKIRRVEYRKWIQSLYEVVSTNDQRHIDEFNKTTNDLFLYASDTVMMAVGAFKHYMAITSRERKSRDMKTAGALLAKVVKEMRNDCFDSTNLPESEIRNMLPIEGVRDDDASE